MGGDVYRIEAHDNGYAVRIQVIGHVILRAAETAEQQGAQGFVVLTSAPTEDRTGAVFTVKLVRDPGPADHYIDAAKTIAETGRLVRGTGLKTWIGQPSLD